MKPFRFRVLGVGVLDVEPQEVCADFDVCASWEEDTASGRLCASACVVPG